MKTGSITCKVCAKRASDGFAIHRISPKGGPFEGVCNEHRLFPVQEPDIATLIERSNRRPTLEQA